MIEFESWIEWGWWAEDRKTKSAAASCLAWVQGNEDYNDLNNDELAGMAAWFFQDV